MPAAAVWWGPWIQSMGSLSTLPARRSPVKLEPSMEASVCRATSDMVARLLNG